MITNSTLEHIINQTNSIVYICTNDSNLSLEYISENISILGYSAYNLVNEQTSFLKLIFTQDLIERKSQLELFNTNVISNGRIEYRMVSNSGKIFRILDVFEIVRNSNNKVSKYQGVITLLNSIDLSNDNDIIKKEELITKTCELTISNQKLYESEFKFKAISDQSHLGIAILLKGILKYYNQAFIQLTKFSEEDIKVWKEYEFFKYIHPDDLSYIKDAVARFDSTDFSEEFHSDFRILENNGNEWTLTHWSKPIVFEGKRATLITLMDIPQQRKNVEHALLESQELYRQLVDTSPDAIVLADLTGSVIFVSPQAKILFGFPIDFCINGLNIFQFIDVSEVQRAIKNVKDVFNNKTVFAGSYRMIKHDKSFFDAEINSAPVFDFNGHPKGMISIIRDISQRKKVEEELIRAKNKAEESDRLKSAFLANMSHEIRTPMNGIIGFSNLLKDEDITVEDKLEYIEIINQNGEHLLKLIDDILDIARIEAGQLNIFLSECNINQIVHEHFLQFKMLLDNDMKKKVQLFEKLPKTELIYKIVSDNARIRQILTNLINNALKFTHEGFVEFGFTVESNQWIQFYVKDTGIGLSLDKQKIVFDRFRQAEETTSRNYGGTGLGLSISSNLVKLLGGKIWVESEINKGSTFFFTIPLRTE